MVPVRLELHNFLSYADEAPPLLLEGLGLVCLSGPNGHGKSALLDALTYALWGEGRKASGAARAQAGLLRTGAAEMWVGLEFDHEATRYRVRRSWRARDARSELTFQVQDPVTGEWRPLSLPTLRATDERIRRLLRMDYDTFVNSAFLKQGRADEFTRRPPAERKQVLADILGLSRYDRLKERALARRRELDARLHQTAQAIAGLTAELARADEVRERLAAVTAELEQRELEARVAAERATAARDRLRADQEQRRLQQEKQRQRDQTASLIADLTADLTAGEAELAELAELLASRPEAAERLAQLEAVEARRTVVEQQLLRAAQLRSEANRLTGELASLEREAAAEERRLREQLDRLLARRRAADEVLATRERIRQRLAAREEARRRAEAAAHQENRHRALTDEVNELQRRVDKARAELEAELKQVGETARAHRQLVAADAELRQQRGELAEAVAAAEAAERELAELDRRRAGWTAEFEGLKQLKQAVDRELAELEQHEALLAAGGGVCPVCGQNLAEEGLAQVEERYRRQREELQLRQRELRQQGRDLKRRLDEAAATTEALARRRDARGELVRELARLEQRLATAAEAAVALEALTQRQQQLKEALAAGRYAEADAERLRAVRRERDELDWQPEQAALLRRAAEADREIEREALQLEAAEEEDRLLATELPAARAALADHVAEQAEGRRGEAERQALAAVTAELETITVGDDDLQTLDAERRELADAPRRWHQIEAAEAGRPGAEERVARLRRRLAEAERRLRESDRDLADLAGQLLADPAELEARAAADEATADDLNRAVARLREERGQLQEASTRLARQAAELTEREAEQRTLAHDRTIAEHLVTAFGRDGIPALIIEHAVPEIEQAANELLASLSGGRMHLQMRLRRPLRGGGDRDTLDLTIGDELGVRSYENYSGGEAFRVDFALRLALSRLLTRRAGARLRTLIIDEGFGTQDAEGLEQLVDALHAVAGQFELILVVTHLEAMKDYFPTRIEVRKEPELGSTFQILGAGAPAG